MDWMDDGDGDDDVFFISNLSKFKPKLWWIIWGGAAKDLADVRPMQKAIQA